MEENSYNGKKGRISGVVVLVVVNDEDLLNIDILFVFVYSPQRMIVVYKLSKNR